MATSTDFAAPLKARKADHNPYRRDQQENNPEPFAASTRGRSGSGIFPIDFKTGEVGRLRFDGDFPFNKMGVFSL
ncbi:MAG: hypothetical protein MPW15_00475 [Candidatus Manganitrophus sp.]|nr:hypothetical protein [Candidatus Manganitrophus sp.]